MYKAIALLKAKSGLSREQLIEYYENTHVPLILECQPQIAGYRRNYIQLDGAIMAPGIAPPDFDVITEIWYPDRHAYETAMTAFAMPDVAQRVAEDEARFLDRSKTRFFVVQEHASAISAGDV